MRAKSGFSCLAVPCEHESFGFLFSRRRVLFTSWPVELLTASEEICLWSWFNVLCVLYFLVFLFWTLLLGNAITRPFNCNPHWEYAFPFKFRDDDSWAMDMQLFSIRRGTRCILTCLPISWQQVMSLCAHRTIIATVGIILIGVWRFHLHRLHRAGGATGGSHS